MRQDGEVAVKSSDACWYWHQCGHWDLREYRETKEAGEKQGERCASKARERGVSGRRDMSDAADG